MTLVDMRKLVCLAAVPLVMAAADRTPAVPPSVIGDPGEWVTPEDYPSEQLRKWKSGTVVFVLTVDDQGRATACSVTESSGVSELDQKACEVLLKRARFVPAKDQKGRPVQSLYRNRVRWQIPQRDPFQATDFLLEFDITPEGKVENCVARNLLYDFEDQSQCSKLMPPGMTLSPRARTTHFRLRHSVEVDHPIDSQGRQEEDGSLPPN